MLYSVLEQHIDGSWWYHKGNTVKSYWAAKKLSKKILWWDAERPRKIIKHKKPFPQKDICTFDFKMFEFAGKIEHILE